MYYYDGLGMYVCMYNVLFVNFVISVAEEDKNRHAVERVETVLREAVWINIHILPVSSSEPQASQIQPTLKLIATNYF